MHYSISAEHLKILTLLMLREMLIQFVILISSMRSSESRILRPNFAHPSLLNCSEAKNFFETKLKTLHQDTSELPTTSGKFMTWDEGMREASFFRGL